MSIPFENFEKAIKDAGLRMHKQAAFGKVAVGKNAVYVALTQKVSRVDLSGFSFAHPAIHKLSEKELANGKYGRVVAQLDFSKNEDRVMEAFSTALAKMKQLAEETEDDTKAPKRKTSGKAKGGRKTRTTRQPATTTEAPAAQAQA